MCIASGLATRHPPYRLQSLPSMIFVCVGKPDSSAMPVYLNRTHSLHTFLPPMLLLSTWTIAFRTTAICLSIDRLVEATAERL